MTTKMKQLFFHICMMMSVMSSAQIPVDFQIGDSIFYNYTEIKLPTDTIPVVIIACDTSHVLVKYSDQDCDDPSSDYFLAYTVITFDGYKCSNAFETYFIDTNKIRLQSRFKILLWQKK